MLSLKINDVAFLFHQKLITCWILRKLNGGRSYRNGHNCKDIYCVICTGREHKCKDVPQAFINFMTVDRIKLLVSGKPLQLIALHNDFVSLNLGNGQQIIENLFVETGYKHWFQPKYGKKFLNFINQDTCTYCNRNYTLQIVPERSRAELDHWFPKATNQLLALSFYNLIPSCHSCNHLKLNGVVDSTFAHPYLMDEENQSFKFSFSYSKSLYKYEIKLLVEENSTMSKSLNDFRIKEIYDIHSERELKDLIDLRYKYSNNYIDILINHTFKGIISESEVYRLIFGIEENESDYHKRPFSKFKMDIIEELKKIT